MARRKFTPSRSTNPKLNKLRKESPKPQSKSSGQTPKSISKSSSLRKGLPEKDTSQSVNQSRRKYTVKRGIKALREIRHLQKSTHYLVPKAAFGRVVREIFQMMGHGDKRIQLEAMAALQEAAEMYCIQFFQDSVLCCYHAHRVTLKPSDIHLVRRLRGAAEVGNA